MHDLPQWLGQQSNARRVSGEELEALGKKAAAAYKSGGAPNMNEAVVETVKHAGLSPEQVRRVIEFANTSAFLDEFQKEGSHRVVELDGGPADPSEVLKDLNDGGGGSVFDTGALDYASPPKHKEASAAHEAQLFDLFKTAGETEFPHENPLKPAMDMREKLAGAVDHMTHQIGSLETVYADLQEELYLHVKQASLSGVPLGDVLKAWSVVTTVPEFTKAAFANMTERLLKEGIFPSLDSMGASIEKTGSARMVNEEHPLVGVFAGHCFALAKLAELRAARDVVGGCLDEMEGFLAAPSDEKRAGVMERIGALFGKKAPPPPKGAVHHVRDFFEGASKPVGSAAKGAGELLFGKGHQYAENMGNMAQKAVQYTPHVGAAALGYRALQHMNAAADNSPAVQKALSFIPTSDQNQMYEAQLQQRYSGTPAYPPYYGY